MRLVVIDTNCLVQILSRRCPYRPIWDAFLAQKFTLCVSNDDALSRSPFPYINVLTMADFMERLAQ